MNSSPTPPPFSGQGIRALVIGWLVWWAAKSGREELAQRLAGRF